MAGVGPAHFALVGIEVSERHGCRATGGELGVLRIAGLQGPGHLEDPSARRVDAPRPAGVPPAASDAVFAVRVWVRDVAAVVFPRFAIGAELVVQVTVGIITAVLSLAPSPTCFDDEAWVWKRWQTLILGLEVGIA